MKFGSVVFEGERFAAIFEEEKVGLVRKEIRGFVAEGGKPFKKVGLGEVKLLPPVPDPQKIVCVGLNYTDHAEELKSRGLLDRLPEKPVLFLKPPSALVGAGGEIVWPANDEVKRVDYEAELAVVIGKKCKRVKAEEAAAVIAGYSCFNDVTARNIQKEDVQWTRAKSFDSFAPFGPWIASGIDATNLSISCAVNAKKVQESNTRNMIFNAFKLVEFISSVMTLEPGDLIATGTPAGVGELKVGDGVEVSIEGIGSLKNKVTREK